jgi:hypothetical protein
VRVVGLLSWYDESPSWLASAVASFAPYLDHLIAIDGAYAAYPGGRPRSELGQAETILRTADAAGLGVTIVEPRDVFYGNEVEKRSLLFRYGLVEATPYEDWFVVFDGDEVLSKAPADLRTRLAYIREDAAEVTLWSRENWGEVVPDVASAIPLPGESRGSLRMFFRALPNLRVHGRHDVYVGERDGEETILWGPDPIGPTPAANLLDVEVEHRSTKRDAARRNAAADYYRTRDALGLEKIATRTIETVDGSYSEVG